MIVRLGEQSGICPYCRRCETYLAYHLCTSHWHCSPRYVSVVNWLPAKRQRCPCGFTGTGEEMESHVAESPSDHLDPYVVLWRMKRDD